MMLPYSYQVKRINLFGVLDLFSWLASSNWRDFSPLYIKLPSPRQVFSSRSVSTTNSAMDEWILQLDSGRQTGLEPHSHKVLIVVERGGGGRKEKTRNPQNWQRISS
jgi:hypothetical protein